MKKFILLLSFLFSANLVSNVIEYTEDIYLMQADKDAVEKISEIAKKMDYSGDYQVVLSKKAGMEINPTLKFFASGVNPVNGLNFIAFNKDWFNYLDKDTQDMFVAIAFSKFINGVASPYAKYVIYIYTILSWFLIFGIFLILNKSSFNFSKHNKLYKFLISLFFVALFNLFFGQKIQDQINNKLKREHAMKVYDYVLEKGFNKDSIVKMLSVYKDNIKKDLEEGQTFWRPFANDFDFYIKHFSDKN